MLASAPAGSALPNPVAPAPFSCIIVKRGGSNKPPPTTTEAIVPELVQISFTEEQAATCFAALQTVIIKGAMEGSNTPEYAQAFRELTEARGIFLTAFPHFGVILDA